jgi:hypothetical protein
MESNPELADFHDAFGQYCLDRYSLGSRAEAELTDGSNDRGIDSYAYADARFHVVQTKIPPADWLAANPKKVKRWTRKVVADPEDALEYLFEDAKKNANDKVRHLYGLIQTAKSQQDFSFTYFLIVYGRLDKRSRESFDALQQRYKRRGINLVLQEIDDLLDDFLVGQKTTGDKVTVDLHVDNANKLSHHSYHYFLVPAGDLFRAFQKYGWRLFDLNVRYEIRNSPVNGDIVSSLSTAHGRKSFHHFNNGLIIVADNARFSDGSHKVKLDNAQIVNGLQTVKSIYNAVSTKMASIDDLDNGCFVQVKIIQNKDPRFVNDVVQATNNQNPMSRRNLKSNNREQIVILNTLATIKPRWFYQRKQGEWDSLTGEGGRYFKKVIGFGAKDFRPEPSKKRGRVIDNQEFAKAWLAFIGFPDWAGDRTSHFFENDKIYRAAFMSSPTEEHWAHIGQQFVLDNEREKTLTESSGGRYQYLLAIGVWQYVKKFLPPPQLYRVQGLEEGHREGKIRKSDGSFKGSTTDHDAYLSTNTNYQVWRVMSNMKTLLVFAVAHILAGRYGTLDDLTCQRLMQSFDLADFEHSGTIEPSPAEVREMPELAEAMVFGRILHFLRFVVQQYWEEKKSALLATSRLRTYLLRAEPMRDLGKVLDEVNSRKSLDKGWKPGGVTFVESLPDANPPDQLRLT